MNDAPISVVIADDHVPLRMGVRIALEAAGFSVCADVGSADAAIAAALQHRPDVCLIDLHMPGGGLRAVADISRTLPEIRIVVLTVSSDSNDLLAALRAGAVGYLLKDMDPSGLPAAVRAAVAGEVSISRTLTSRIVDEIRHTGSGRRIAGADGRSVQLTPREWEVLDLLADDMSTGQIAVRLQLDQVTVRRHVSGLVRKLGAANREDAVRLLNSPLPPR